jgi:hypothetical protein
MARSIRCVVQAAGLLVLLACRATDLPDEHAVERAPSEESVRAIVEADPAFGGGDAFEQRLAYDVHMLTGNRHVRRLFVKGQKDELDAQAAALVREHVTAELADAVAPFLGSDVGKRLGEAEVLALGMFRSQPDSFPALAAAHFADPARVGKASQVELDEVRKAIREERSPPKEEIALVMAAGTLSPDDARAVGAFYATATGARWLDVRMRVFPIASDHYRDFLRKLVAHGFFRSSPDLEPATGPQAEATDRGDTAPR